MNSPLLQQAVEALTVAHAGLQWYRDLLPDAVDASDAEADEQINAALASLVAAIQQQPEAVAWRDVRNKCDLYFRKPEQIDVEPLYTAPPALQLQEGKGEAVARYEQMRLTLIGQVHELIDIAERHAWTKDEEEKRRTLGAIAHARKVTAPYNYNGAPSPSTAVQQEAGSGWKPIATAPKDGREVILREGSRVGSACWVEWPDTHDNDGAPNADGGEGWTIGYDGDEWRNPTGWQPLPSSSPSPARQQESAIVEAIARQWDGCMAPMFDAAGNATDAIDIGATIRADGAPSPSTAVQQEAGSTAAVHLTADEIASLMMDLSEHDGRDFEAECPSCTAFRKLASACVAADPTQQHPSPQNPQRGDWRTWQVLPVSDGGKEIF